MECCFVEKLSALISPLQKAKYTIHITPGFKKTALAACYRRRALSLEKRKRLLLVPWASHIFYVELRAPNVAAFHTTINKIPRTLLFLLRQSFSRPQNYFENHRPVQLLFNLKNSSSLDNQSTPSCSKKGQQLA